MTSYKLRKALQAGQIVEVAFGDKAVDGLARCLGGATAKAPAAKRAPTAAELELAAAYRAHVASQKTK
jgi:hypothetical protein